MTRRAGTLDRFIIMLERGVGLLPDGVLDQLPTPAQTSAAGVGGVDVNKARTRAARADVLARWQVVPDEFTVANPAGWPCALTRASEQAYTVLPLRSASPFTTRADYAASSQSSHSAGPAVTARPARCPHHRHAADPP